MKTICIVCLYAFALIQTKAQVTEFIDINTKKEFAGIPFI